MKTLAGKIVLITGASSGIGRATAFAFAAEGARLLLCARRLNLLMELEAPLMRAGAAAVLLFQLDVRERGEVEATLEGLPTEWREIAVLVNNAGLSRGMTKVYEDDPENWDESFDVVEVINSGDFESNRDGTVQVNHGVQDPMTGEWNQDRFSELSGFIVRTNT